MRFLRRPISNLPCPHNVFDMQFALEKRLSFNIIQYLRTIVIIETKKILRFIGINNRIRF